MKTKISAGILAAGALLTAGFFGEEFRPMKAPKAAATKDRERARAVRPEPGHLPTQAEEETAQAESSWTRELRELRELAASAPDTAFARVARLADKHDRRAAAREVSLIVAETDPAKAAQTAWRLELGKFADGPAENAALEELSRRWAHANAPQASAWLATLPADDEARRDRVAKGVVAVLARQSPADAARFVTTQISSGSSVQLDAALDVLREWRSRDYAAALQWTATLPPGAIQDRAMDELAKATGAQ